MCKSRLLILITSVVCFYALGFERESFAQPQPGTLKRTSLQSQHAVCYNQSAKVGNTHHFDSWTLFGPISIEEGRTVTANNDDGLASQQTTNEAEVNAAFDEVVDVGTATAVGSLSNSLSSALNDSRSAGETQSDAYVEFEVQNPSGAPGAGFLRCEIHIVGTLNETGGTGTKGARGHVVVGPSRVDYSLDNNGTWHIWGTVGEGGREVDIDESGSGLDHHYFFTHATTEGAAVTVESYFEADCSFQGPATSPGKTAILNGSGTGGIRPYFSIQ